MLSLTSPAKAKVPDTIARLRALRPDEGPMVYYRGNFDLDIARCDTVLGESGSDAPACRALLNRIRETAKYLAKGGKVQLEQRPIPKFGQANRQYEYLATRLHW